MSKKHIAKAHDHFFRRMMSDPEVARDFFKTHLPKDVLAKVDLTALELQSGSHIDDIGKEAIVDMLFKAPLDGHTAYFYLLVDHQSRPDELMPFRIIKYVCNVIDQHLKETGTKRIPLVVPLVVYHGKRPWHYSTDINDLVEAPRYLVDAYFLKPFNLLDLTKIDDVELRRRTWAGVMELTLKHIFSRDMLPYIEEVIKAMQPLEQNNGKILTEIVLLYIMDRAEVTDKNLIIDLITANLSPEVGEKIMSIAEQFREEGKQQGMQQGIRKEKEQTAERLLKIDMDVDSIKKITDLPREEIIKLKQNLH